MRLIKASVQDIQVCMVQVNVAIMLAPVTFLGHIASQPVEAMARMQTDGVSHDILHTTLNGSMLLLLLLLLLLHCQH